MPRSDDGRLTVARLAKRRSWHQRHEDLLGLAVGLVLPSAPAECELLVVGTFSTRGSVLASSTPMLSERKSRCPDDAEAPSGTAVEGYFGA
jgi:hypothetical protein